MAGSILPMIESFTRLRISQTPPLKRLLHSTLRFPKIPKRAVAATVGIVATSFTLASCVTNEEQGNPDGWEQIVPDPVAEIQAMVPEALAQRGVLTAGANPPFPPFEFKDSDGQIIGVEMDLVRAMAGVMGLEFSPQEQDFSLILPSVQAGTLDIGASGFTDNEERRENFDFIDFLYAGVQGRRQLIVKPQSIRKTPVVSPLLYSAQPWQRPTMSVLAQLNVKPKAKSRSPFCLMKPQILQLPH